MTAIGASTTAAALPGQPGKAALEAEIARYQQQLAECISCPSSKTREGKANIQAISNKIRADKTQLHHMEGAAAAEDSNTYSRTGARSYAAAAIQGGLVNVYA